MAVLGLALTTQAQLLPKTVTLAWDPIPPAEITPDLTVRIYHETSLVVPKALWVMLAEVPATNNTATITLQPGQHFFVAKSYSAFWKLESDFSNTCSTPPAASSLFNLTIRLGL